MASEGYALLCCEDYGQRQRFDLLPSVLVRNADFIKHCQQLHSGIRSTDSICGSCEVTMVSWPHSFNEPRLDSSPRWNAVEE